MLSFKPTFSLSSFTFIKRLFSSSSLSAIRVLSSAYLRLLIFLVYMSIPVSQFIPTPLSLLGVYTFVLYIYLHFCFVNRFLKIHFSRFYLYALIYNICFSLSDLLHSVWQTLGPFTSLQMTYFVPLYGWVIFHCIYVLRLLYPFICGWTLRLLSWCGCCKQCFIVVAQLLCCCC